MIKYRFKIFNQLSQECCKVVMCEKNIREEAIKEYFYKVKEVDLPDGEYFSRLYRVLIVDGKERNEDMDVDVISFPLVCKNHTTQIK